MTCIIDNICRAVCARFEFPHAQIACVENCRFSLTFTGQYGKQSRIKAPSRSLFHKDQRI